MHTLVHTACDEDQYLEINNLSIKMPFKLHGQLAQLIDSESGSMYAGGKQVLTIRRGFQAVASSWELQILHQLNLPPAECKEAVSDVFTNASDKQVLAMQTNLSSVSAQPAACRLQNESKISDGFTHASG